MMNLSQFNRPYPMRFNYPKMDILNRRGLSPFASGYRGSFRLVRGSTAINIGDASSSVQRMTFSSIETKNNSATEQVSSNFLDSPSSTSSVT